MSSLECNDETALDLSAENANRYNKFPKVWPHLRRQTENLQNSDELTNGASISPNELEQINELEENIKELSAQCLKLQQASDEGDVKLSMLKEAYEASKMRFGLPKEEQTVIQEETTTEYPEKSQINLKRKRDSEMKILEPEINIQVAKYPRVIDAKSVLIGSNGTTISVENYIKLKLTDVSRVTRGLLEAVFDAHTLATHSLTGKPSPAFLGRERPVKDRLDPKKVDDIIECVMNLIAKTKPKDVRSAITTKCAEVAKRLKPFETI